MRDIYNEEDVVFAEGCPMYSLDKRGVCDNWCKTNYCIPLRKNCEFSKISDYYLVPEPIPLSRIQARRIQMHLDIWSAPIEEAVDESDEELYDVADLPDDEDLYPDAPPLIPLSEIKRSRPKSVSVLRYRRVDPKKSSYKSESKVIWPSRFVNPACIKIKRKSNV